MVTGCYGATAFISFSSCLGFLRIPPSASIPSCSAYRLGVLPPLTLTDIMVPLLVAGSLPLRRCWAIRLPIFALEPIYGSPDVPINP